MTAPVHIFEQRFRTLNAHRVERARAFFGAAARDAFDALPDALAAGDDVLGIYLMGSAGTFGQGRDSDLRTFLVDAAALRAGERCLVAGDDCGSTQDRLLLDEFYRTAVVLRGAPPMWWLVAAEDEDHYDTLAAALPADGYLDLGGLPAIPEDEFLGATLWHLHKAIDTPHKSLLKLLLLESYALERVEPLALEFKRRVQAPGADLARLDPYVLMYRRIERYLSRRRDARRLALARTCLLRRAEAHGATGWQRAWAAEFRAEWGWPPPTEGPLPIATLLHEHREIARQLEVGHTLLRQWANAMPTRFAADRDLRLLEAELAAHTVDWPGKVQRLNHGLKRTLEGETLMLIQKNQARGGEWALATRCGAELVSGVGLTHIAAWSSLNGLWPDEPTPLATPPYDHVAAAIARFAAQGIEDADYLEPPATRRDLLVLHDAPGWVVDRVTLNSWGEVSARSLYGLGEISTIAGEIDPTVLEVHAPGRREDADALRAVLAHRPGETRAESRLLVERPGSVLVREDQHAGVRELFDRAQVLAEIAARPCATEAIGDGDLLAPLRALIDAARSGDTGAEAAHVALLASPTAAALGHADGVLLLDRDGAMTYLALPSRPVAHQCDTLRVFLANVARRLRIPVHSWSWRDEAPAALVGLTGRAYLPEPVVAVQHDGDRLDVNCAESAFKDVGRDTEAARAARARVLSLREQRRGAAAVEYPITVTDVCPRDAARATVRTLFAVKVAAERLLEPAAAT